MDQDGSDSDWHSLGHDLHHSVLSVLKRRKDKVSLQAVMQTSRDLRLLASSIISAIEVRDGSVLAHYPRHAAAINKIQLRMNPSPEKAHMEPPGMVIYLAACNLLSLQPSGGRHLRPCGAAWRAPGHGARQLHFV